MSDGNPKITISQDNIQESNIDIPDISTIDNGVEDLSKENTPIKISEILNSSDSNNNTENTTTEKDSIPVNDTSSDVKTQPLIIDNTKNPDDIGSGNGEKPYLQLGDVIKVISSNEQYSGKMYYIDYIGSPKIVVIESVSLDKVVWSFVDGIIDDGSVTQINILEREKSPSYAKQNNLLPYAWIDIYFEDLSIITGQIMSLEEDMIEIRVYPSDSLNIYINFEYKGIPENSGITEVKIRNSPPQPSLAPQKFELVDENIAPIQEILEADKNKFMYSIEEQTNDMLEVLLSKVASSQRNNVVLNKINTMITRFKQLHKKYTMVDKNDNISKDTPFKLKTKHWKPLTEQLLELNNKLFWIVMVGKYKNNVIENVSDVLSRIMIELDMYNNDTVSMDQNRYVELYRKINDSLTPFENIDRDDMQNIIYQHQVNSDLNVINNYDGDFYTVTKSKHGYKYYTQRFNTGLNYITQPKSVNVVKSIFNKLTESDTLSLRSIITLPKELIQFSKVNLPETNILKRSNLGMNFIQYWKLFKMRNIFSNTTIRDFDTPIQDIQYDKMKNYELNLPGDLSFSSKDKYSHYLNHIIPETREIFQLFKNNIRNKLSFKDVVDELEPFLIYPEDITFQQYKDINKYINNVENGQIKLYVEGYTTRKSEFAKIVNAYKANDQTALNNIFELVDASLIDPSSGNKIRDDNIEHYFKLNAEQNVKLTNSELLKSIIDKDFGVNLTLAILLSNNLLLTPENIVTSINDDKKGLENIENPCKNYVIAKKYNSNDALERDNGVEIFFDEEYDDIKYDILEDIQEEFYKKKSSLDKNIQQAEFVKFLNEKLVSKYKFKDENIGYVTESLLSHSKKVLNGHYGFIITDSGQEKPDITFFRRVENQWVMDPDVPKQMIDPVTLCNSQPTCLYNKQNLDSTCENMDNVANKNEGDLLNNMVKEIENQYQESIEEHKQLLQSRYDTSVLNLIYNMNRRMLDKTDRYKVSIGNTVNDRDITISPYSKYLDIIMSNPDFQERQGLIVTFHEVCTRLPNIINLDVLTGETEDPEWYYCKKTNVKLLPKFLYDLALGFQNGEYKEKMDAIIRTNGVISDDGDKIIDKYSGRIIKMIDFDVEEGYNEEGFRIVTRSILEQDISNKTFSTQAVKRDIKKYITNESKIINNIIETLSANMKVDVDYYHDFIIKKVSDLFKDTDIVPSESAYNEKIKMKMDKDTKKGKADKYDTYEEFINKSILYLTIGCFIIAVQISIPEIKTKYTFPGCVKSFTGYPFLGDGDFSCITYFACVALQHKMDYFPWKMLTKKSKSKALPDIEENLKKYIDAYFKEDIEILDMVEAKNKYLLESKHPHNVAEDTEHDIHYWGSFLPAIVPFHIKQLLNVGEHFEQNLLQHLKTGNNKQQEEMLVIRSKILYFSFAIQEHIYKTITKEQLLMSNSERKLLVENACCNNAGSNNTLQFFVGKEPEIQTYNKVSIGNTVNDRDITISPYSKYLDIIMSNPDFQERQGLIVTFHEVCTRLPNIINLDVLTGETEDPEWYYCKKTNVKLLPKFLYDLALGFQNGEYKEKMDAIIRTNGVISDDGDKIIDKYSGRIIKMIDFDVEEGYNEEGFRIVTRSILEQDISNKTFSTQAVKRDIKKYITNESKIINNIIETLSANMKVDVDYYHDFIIKKVSDLFKDTDIVPSESAYNEKIKMKMDKDTKKGKADKYDTYEEFINKSILYLTIGCFIIAVQISIPEIKTKYTFPGCVKSFTGYPFLGDGDFSCITYFACVALQHKMDYFPWKMLTKKSKSKALPDIEENLKKYIDAYFKEDIEILDMVEAKNKYLLESKHPHNVAEDTEHDIHYWGSFLPAIVPFHIKQLLNVGEHFEQNLLQHLKTGNNKQQEEMLVIRSKILYFSFAIQEHIYKTITKEQLLMSNSERKLLVENACCNNAGSNNTLQFFVGKEPEIQTYNNLVSKFTTFLNDIRILTIAPLFLSIEKTKMKTETLLGAFNEKTIYLSFVKYCNFKNSIPNSAEINGICGGKPNYINNNDSINEIISKLKMDNRNYNDEQLLRLLQIVTQSNIIRNEESVLTHTPNETLTKLIENMDSEDDALIHANIRNELSDFLSIHDIYEMTDNFETSESEKLNRILFNLNYSMTKEVIDFVKKQKQVSNNMIGFLENYKKFVPNDNYNEYTMFNFIKNSIAQMGKIFPSMIQTNANYRMDPREYWNITSNHISNIKRISEEEFRVIDKYYNNPVIQKLLENVKINTKHIIDFAEKIPIIKTSKFTTETSILLVEHCFLLVLIEYKKLSTLDVELNEEDEEGPKLLQNKKQLEKMVVILMKDLFEIIISTHNKITISYDKIMDNIFKLKEAEKNRIRQRAEIMNEDERKIDNEFKNLRIGEWGKGENVTGYDGERYDEEFKIMGELNAQVKQKMRQSNMDEDDVLDDINAQRFIDIDNEMNDDRENDYDDGDYYQEDGDN